MNKKYIPLVVLFLSVSCFAQTGKVLRAGLSGMERTVRRAAALRLPAARASVKFSVPSLAVERYVFHPIALTPRAKVPVIADGEPSGGWLRETLDGYTRVLTDFQNFKREMDVLLYYQSIPSERRELHPEETARIQREINGLSLRLNDLRLRVNSDDPAFAFALEYVDYVRWMLYPHARDLFFAPPLAPRTDRVFQLEEFFLRDPFPLESRWEREITRARRLADKLPAGLRVAVVNDWSGFRLRVAELHRKGLFFPSGQTKVFASAEELLAAVKKTGKQFDVIFTDMVVFSGGGGYFLASELRHQGYGGTIIALSSYEESEELGRRMLDYGIDGMVRLSGGDEYARGWSARMMQSVLNYFYYRDLHGWDR